MSKQFIPPIIEDMVFKVNDPQTNASNQDNYAQVLERTRTSIDKALMIYEQRRKTKKVAN